MVSMALGLLLLAAFFAVLQQCRAGFSTGESLAALQDNARHALSVLVPDIEHAGFYGFAGPAARLTRGGTVLAEGAQLQQPDAAHPAAAVAGLPAGAHDCGTNFAVDLGLAVQGGNNVYAAGPAATNCTPTASAGGARAGTDTLTLRHASLRMDQAARRPTAAVYTRRLESQLVTRICSRMAARPGPTIQTRTCAISRCTCTTSRTTRWSGRQWPALRVKALTESRGAAQFRDEEVLPGVEDLQVELGVRDPGTPRTPALLRRAGFSGTARAHRVRRAPVAAHSAPTAPSRASSIHAHCDTPGWNSCRTNGNRASAAY
jgi:Tfp pilus assembly protein PilW